MVVPRATPLTAAPVLAANSFILAATSAGAVRPSRAIRYAANPATCGHAVPLAGWYYGRIKCLPMLVPLKLSVAVLLVIPTLKTLTPGAKISNTAPKLEKEALASVFVVAPTVMAEGADAGESLAAFT